VREHGPAAVLKTASFGYDGKGQSKVRSLAEAEAAVGAGDVERIYEAFVDFDREVSVVAARGLDGSFAHWGVIANDHVNHILDLSIAPADLPTDVASEAVEIARGILEQLNVVGVLCVEFFLTRSGKLLVNELAPRPHNSGHFTIDASSTSQFEQQLRAVCGLPLGSTRLHRPAAMAQLLGDLWEKREPNWAAACAVPNVKLHLYGKSDPRTGRKMGHLTALAESASEAARVVKHARELL
jgi:5-(carboxyamino)imidazole ribonucleotide synthase